MPNTRDNLKGLLREQTAQMHQYDTILSPENELLPYEFESYPQMEAIDTGRSTNWQTDFLSDMSDFESTLVDDVKQWFQATAKNKLSTNLSNKQDALAEQEAKAAAEAEKQRLKMEKKLAKKNKQAADAPVEEAATEEAPAEETKED